MSESDEYWRVLICFKLWYPCFSCNCINLLQVLAVQEMHSATRVFTGKDALKWTLGTRISTQRSTISRTIENWKMFMRRFRKELQIKDLKVQVNKNKVDDIVKPPIFTEFLCWIDLTSKCESVRFHIQMWNSKIFLFFSPSYIHHHFVHVWFVS